MYENIIVAFDNTEHSKAAVVEASGWVKRHGGKITLVHAVYFDEEEFGNAPEQLEKRFTLGRNVCYQTKEMVAADFGLEADAVVCEGEPPEVITNVAAEKRGDLIAMGTYGRKGIKRMLMGSVTSSVISQAPCDVLVVKGQCPGCKGPYSSVLVPFDGSDFSRKALSKACQLAKTEGAQVTVLYVIPRYEEMLGFFRTESIEKRLVEEAAKITESAREFAAGLGVSVNSEMRQGQAGDEITKVCAGLKTDLIVLGTYGWRGVNKAIMGSTTERVIMHATCPVLAVR